MGNMLFLTLFLLLSSANTSFAEGEKNPCAKHDSGRVIPSCSSSNPQKASVFNSIMRNYQKEIYEGREECHRVVKILYIELPQHENTIKVKEAQASTVASALSSGHQNQASSVNNVAGIQQNAAISYKEISTIAAAAGQKAQIVFDAMRKIKKIYDGVAEDFKSFGGNSPECSSALDRITTEVQGLKEEINHLQNSANSLEFKFKHMADDANEKVAKYSSLAATNSTYEAASNDNTKTKQSFQECLSGTRNCGIRANDAHVSVPAPRAPPPTAQEENPYPRMDITPPSCEELRKAGFVCTE